MTTVAIPLDETRGLSQMLLSGFKKAASVVGSKAYDFVKAQPIFSFVATDVILTGGAWTIGGASNLAATLTEAVVDGVTGAASSAFDGATGAVGDFTSSAVDKVTTSAGNLVNNAVNGFTGLFVK